jgi:hypothetical protein
VLVCCAKAGSVSAAEINKDIKIRLFIIFTFLQIPS